MSSSQPGLSQPQQLTPLSIVINLLTHTSMEMGYTHSPMAHILEEYSAEHSKDNHSTYYRVLVLPSLRLKLPS